MPRLGVVARPVTRTRASAGGRSVGARFARPDNEPSANLRLGREQLRLSRAGNDLPPCGRRRGQADRLGAHLAGLREQHRRRPALTVMLDKAALR